VSAHPAAARRLTAGVLLLALALPAAAGAGPDRLGALAREYREHRLAVRPDLATLAGDHRGDRRLEPVTQASLIAEAAWLDDFARRLAALPGDGLSPPAAAERDSLAARTVRARAEIVVARRWEQDPTAYLDLVDGAIRTMTAPPRGSACARTRAAADRLARVPEVLRSARVNLREPEPQRADDAAAGCARLLELCRVAVPALGARCREPRLQADLAEADTLAVRAVEDFARWLREDIRSAGANR